MKIKKIDIYVYADWIGLNQPQCIGVLSAQQAKSRKSFSFEYDKDWIKSNCVFLLDPDLSWVEGPQYPDKKENFGLFLDSMPDRWGQVLMQRKEAQTAKEENRTVRTLYDIDFLLGVFDPCRMGALRFKLEKEGDFLDNNAKTPIPSWSSIRELQDSAKKLESDDDSEIKKHLEILIAPGSSLGGARPKANVLDENKQPWIAKFPSKNDAIDKAAWEYLAYRLAIQAGIEMSESKIEKIADDYHTFLTKRFDRQIDKRIHFASAMTMTGNNEDSVKDNKSSYLDLAEFITDHSSKKETDLRQLWRRIVFNIAISNTDDHLRNHGFIIKDGGWRLSPAYDINPSIDKDGLAINIDSMSNALDLDLAKSVGEYFELDEEEMDKIIEEVKNSVQNWRKIAKEIGISNNEQNRMESAFMF